MALEILTPISSLPVQQGQPARDDQSLAAPQLALGISRFDGAQQVALLEHKWRRVSSDGHLNPAVLYPGRETNKARCACDLQTQPARP
ncbi:hypothetical protein FQN52_004777 [Onygenales sp. PD_12]|nr:hypothetical protein FQN52_004777 [Onygenales sp. PD_12]KAK2802280.1 hypothetical protein FQN51_004569 [Onygenales sp. PD_10]